MTGRNPYVGPRPFVRGQKLYGRDREQRDLVNLLVAERIVLMYSPSGAGKTSLIQAAVVPDLEERGFRVRGVMRVNHEPPSEGGNRYLQSIRRELAIDRPRRPGGERTGGFTDGSSDALGSYLVDDAAEVLIFDQFEEILTLDPTDITAKDEFFAEVGRVLDHPTRRALFAMREEFVAGLDPYVLRLPHSLDVRYRLGLLDQKRAEDAIAGPVNAVELPSTGDGERRTMLFEPKAAELLAEQLRTVTVQVPGREAEVRRGPSVEPVQLQIVCERLWANRADSTTITVDDVEREGDAARAFVDESLAMYYAERVAEVAHHQDVPERDLRDWIGTHLISEHGIRLSLLDGGDVTAGYRSEIIDALEDARIVRREDRGRRFIEVSHDRLVGPIVEDNARWAAKHLDDWQQAAQLWARRRLDSLLVTGRAFRTALASVPEDQRTEAEHRFLAASEKVHRAAQRRAIGRSVIVILGLVAIVVGTFAVFAWQRANTEADRATSRQLASLASDPATPNAIGLVLAREAYELAPTVEARGALLTVLERHPAVDRFIHRHDDRVVSVGFSPDGRWIVSGSDDRTVQVVELDSGRVVELTGHEQSVVAVEFNADGSLLASSDDAGVVRLWDVATWEPAMAPARSSAPRVRTVAFHPSDPGTLATGDQDGAIEIWDVGGDAPRRVRRFVAHADEEGPKEVRSIDFDPSGAVLASGGDDFQVRLWDWASGTQIGEPMGDHGDLVRAVAFGDAPNTRILASGGNDRRAIIWRWDPEEGLSRAVRVGGAQIPALEGHEERIYDLDFVPGTNLLATASRDRTVILWNGSLGTRWSSDQFIGEGGGLGRYDQGDGVVTDPLDAHTGAVRAIAFAPRPDDGDLVMATASNDRTVAVWHPLRRARFGTWLVQRPGATWAADRHPTEPVMATAVDTTRLQFWDVVAAEPLGDPFDAHEGTIRVARFSADGRLVATGGDDCTVRLWSYPDGDLVSELAGHDRSVTTAVFTPDGSRVITAGQDGRVIEWSIPSGTSDELTRIGGGDPDLATCADAGIAEFDASNRFRIPMSVDVTADGEWLLAAVNDGSYRVWDRVGRGELVTLPAEDVVAIPGRLPRSGIDYGLGPDEITLWDLPETWTPLDDPGSPWLRLASPLVSGLASGPDATLVAPSGDGTFRLWDIATGRPLGGAVSASAPLAAAFGFPDESLLVTVSVGGTVAVWDLDVDRWLSAVCPVAGRSLDETQWSVYVADRDYRATCDGR